MWKLKDKVASGVNKLGEPPKQKKKEKRKMV